MKVLKNNRGQNNMGGGVMAVIFGTILIVAVAIPVTQDAISTANLTGITSTIVGFIPVFLGLGGLALAASMV